MAVGAMRHRLELQAYTRTADDGGGASLAWAKVAAIWGQIEPQSAREAVFGRDNQMRETKSHKITIRYRDGVTSANRLVQVYKIEGRSFTRIWNITGVLDPDNRRRFLELSCEEGVPT